MKKGFTLIEILIVITIIGILAVALVPTLLDSPTQARDAQRIATLEAIQEALTYGVLKGEDLPTAASYGLCFDETLFPKATHQQAWANLGGAIPMDPKATFSARIDSCADGDPQPYAYKSDPYNGGVDPVEKGTYSYAIWAQVENLENANAHCNYVHQGLKNDPVANYPCYALLVQ